MAQINANITSEDDTKYSNCEESQNILNGNDDNVVCLIRRKRASNLVVYRANIEINQANMINSKQPIEIFWLKLSKDDLKSHRESGKMDDRVEISKIERKLAYGITCKSMTKINKKNTKKSRWRSSNKIMDNSSSSSSYKVTFNALKSFPMILRIDENDHKPYLFGNLMIDGISIECKLKEIWVTMKKGTFGIPKVDYLTIKAIQTDNNQSIEYIMRK